MPRLKTQAAKESLLRRVRKQRLNYITVLPSLITLLNGVCGFASIGLAAKGSFTLAGYVLLLAMIADMLDGRVARMSRTTSSFGGQLDSLCDVISFGVAPAFLMLKIIELKLTGIADPHAAFAHFLERFIWLVAAAYLSCAAIRLARFNVENEEDESAHMSFVGLPTPAAAGVVVSLVLIHQEVLPDLAEDNIMAYNICENLIIYSLPLVLLVISFLMVSRIRYPHIVNQYIKGRKPFANLIGCMLLVGLFLWFRQIVLAVGFCGFALSGLLKWLYGVISKKNLSLTITDSAESDLTGVDRADISSPPSGNTQQPFTPA